MSRLLFDNLCVGPLDTNCYIIWDQNTLSGAIIDPGGDKSRIIDAVLSHHVRVERILLTHAHPDHSFHAGELAGRYRVGVAMHEADVELLTQSLAIAELFYDLSTYVPFSPSELLADGDVLTFGESRVAVAHTPGHSPGGLCFLTEAGVFCGDTVFAGSVGRTDFPGGSHEQLVASIRTKLLVLDDSTRLYPGHGPATTVGIERRTNAFLRSPV